jgi:hypothetical protein
MSALDLTAWAAVFAAVAWAFLGWAHRAARLDRAGVAVTTGTLGAMCASTSILLALAACYVIGQAR